MADIRIKVAKDKAKLVKALKAGEGSTGPFQTYYEVLIFAASLGIQEKEFLPFDEINASRDIDPIRQDQFSSKGYEQVINLIAVMHSGQPKVLEQNTVSEKGKIAIFEAYANGGLSLLNAKLKGSQDISAQISLYISKQKENYGNSNIDLLDIESIFRV